MDYREAYGWPQRLWAWLCLAAAVAFAGILTAMVALYAVDVPFWDQWELVPLLEKSYDSGLSVADFWQQHNEHRIVFPKLIMLALARLTHWDVRWESAVSLVLAVAVFALYWARQRRTAREIGHPHPALMLAVASLLVFSVAQWRNWLWGWQLQILLAVFTVTLGLKLISSAPFRAWRFVLAAACGVIATFSFGNGFLFWPVSLLVVYSLRRQKIVDPPPLFAWLAIGVVVCTAFFYRYSRPSYNTWEWEVWRQAPAMAAYVLTYLGAPVVHFWQPGALIAGAVGTALYAAMLLWLVRGAVEKKWLLASYAALPFYAGLSACATAVARISEGVSQALSSRYVTFGVMFWLGVLSLLYVFAYRREGWMRRAALAFIMLVCAFAAASSAKGVLSLQERSAFVQPARVALQQSAAGELVSRLHPDPGVIVERRPVLIRHELSVFRGLKPRIKVVVSPATPRQAPK